MSTKKPISNILKALKKLMGFIPSDKIEEAKAYELEIVNQLKLREITIEATDSRLNWYILEGSFRIDVKEIRDEFDERPVFSFSFPDGSEPVSDWLIEGRSLIKEYFHMRLEASHRMTIDLILMESLKYMHAKLKLMLRVEEKMVYKTDYFLGSERVTISATPDYDIGYDDENASRLFIVEAKKGKNFSDADICELIAQLGIVHSHRKDSNKLHSTVYGALATALSWQFYRISDDGKVSRSDVIRVDSSNVGRILFIIGHISQLIVDATPSLSLDDLVGGLSNVDISAQQVV
ncbi:hypothetical protein MIR68_006826 [Amoeboaphelidium protococcarum]|nr:hypothetical protein MIR68_006826 [Amoeboaphelidium protococcarum]